MAGGGASGKLYQSIAKTKLFSKPYKRRACSCLIYGMKIFTAKQGERPSPLNDFLFFKIMGEKGDEVQLLSFLNAVLGRTGEDKFVSVEIMENKTFAAEAAGGKSSVLDVIAVLHGGTKVNVEVQIRNQHNMDRRSLFYWSRLYTKSLGEGQDYRELPKVISINILNFELLPAGDYHTCFHLKEDKDNFILTDVLEIHFIDMVKWRRLDGKDMASEPLHRWLAWLDPRSTPELVKEVVNMDSAIQMAEERQEDVLSDWELWRLNEMRLKGQMDRVSFYNDGIEDGMERRTTEIARRLKAIGRPLHEIAEATGLAPGTIEKL